ncbi:MAG: hypothetical protein EGR76_06605 [Prevotella stercorea]|nr:hypothetical protein [Leyella stercorea]
MQFQAGLFLLLRCQLGGAVVSTAPTCLQYIFLLAWNLWAQKKGLRRVPTFVNLKSNTMKNIAKVLILRYIAKF